VNAKSLAFVVAGIATTLFRPSWAAADYYLPDEIASSIVTVAPGAGSAQATVVVLTQALATKESGPKESVDEFGEVYAFAPSFIAVHRNKPTVISLWNLQTDDDHDFMMVAPGGDVLMNVKLPAMQKTTYRFTFHREGLFTFYCTMHQPEMNGQILVLPPETY